MNKNTKEPAVTWEQLGAEPGVEMCDILADLEQIAVEKARAQFDKAKDQAKVIYTEVTGYAGVKSAEQWDELLKKARDDIGSGHFITRCLGAQRNLNGETVAILVCFRQDLIAEQSKITAKKMMLIDAAIFHYYNMTRIQGWLGNPCLNFEAHAFGQRLKKNTIKAETVKRLEEDAKRLNDVCLPALDRATRSLMRSLSALE